MVRSHGAARQVETLGHGLGDAVPVSVTTLLRGYREAYMRWMTGPRVSGDPDGAFLGIFEALNWAVVVDDALRQVMAGGKGWANAYDGGAVVAGFRYARNAVHHDWSVALELRPGLTIPTPIPAILAEWIWQQTLDASRNGGVTQYKRHLAGRPVRFTLETLNTLYDQAAATLELSP